ncbi:MAG: ABC transporter substrate-binding protein [Candidatus Adiutrix sp.]|nr:ABC transporter substrate-binding protein [Candidatus Adiutrix sp.]
MKAFSWLFLLILVCPTMAGAEEKTLEVGYFPNVTHAQALIAQNMAAEGQGWFEKRLPGVAINWHSFNAGPSAMEALFAGVAHLTYVGPNPVLNAYIRSQGGVYVGAGAVRGGAGLVVPNNSSLSQPLDFKGQSIATPQLGNTQDIACRYWLIQAGLKVSPTGGEVTIVPTPNPSILPLFIKGEIAGAWTVEPWLSRLEMEGGGKLVYSEPAETSLTTVLSVSGKFQKEEPELTAKFIKAHQELTEWIKEHPEEAQKRVAAELTRQMRREFPIKLVQHAWPRLVFENKVRVEEFQFALKAAQTAGLVSEEPGDLSGLVPQP